MPFYVLNYSIFVRLRQNKGVLNMKQNARIYARVSRDEQVKYGYSIDAQLTALKEYCNQNKITISGIYVDEGISAATTK
ncbi:hypothetical protein DW906_03200 [Coprobacillus sp. AM42-12AC]|nr:hypothetical protein DW906_03200 [Coprobacillus sp. AM42-12AC]